jgi:hypothetical protein
MSHSAFSAIPVSEILLYSRQSGMEKAEHAEALFSRRLNGEWLFRTRASRIDKIGLA